MTILFRDQTLLLRPRNYHRACPNLRDDVTGHLKQICENRQLSFSQQPRQEPVLRQRLDVHQTRRRQPTITSLPKFLAVTSNKKKNSAHYSAFKSTPWLDQREGLGSPTDLTDDDQASAVKMVVLPPSSSPNLRASWKQSARSSLQQLARSKPSTKRRRPTS